MSINYNYFDQFKDVEVDLSPYLQAIKDSTGYDYKFSNIQPVKTTLKNLFDKVVLLDSFKKEYINFDTYEVNNNESIEYVSYVAYKTVDYWWIIAIFNDIKDIFYDWVKTEDQIQYIADQLYETENKYSRRVYYDMLVAHNEKRRTLLVLKPEFINTVVSAYRSEIEKVTNGN